MTLTVKTNDSMIQPNVNEKEKEITDISDM